MFYYLVIHNQNYYVEMVYIDMEVTVRYLNEYHAT